LSRRMTRKQIAVAAPALFAVASFAHLGINAMWQSVALILLVSPLLVASVIALAPLILQLLPRSGGLGERIGLAFAPFSLFTAGFAFLSAAAVDSVGSYRVIWVFPTVLGLAHALVMTRLWVPPGHEHTRFGEAFARARRTLGRQVSR